MKMHQITMHHLLPVWIQLKDKMGFLSNIFKKKPGGTVVGNLIRGVVNKASSGVLGTGAGMISQKDYDKRVLTDVEFYSRYGETKNGVVLPEYQQTAANQPTPETKTPLLQTIGTSAAKTLLHEYWQGILFIFTLISLGIYSLIKRK